MSFQAAVLPVMIASPGDVHRYRAIARDVLHEWNYIHCESTSVVLMPVGWETHSSPELGATAQELINDRVLEECDLLIGIFWTRLGTPTERAESGTVEEIKRHVDAGKPAMVYFSLQPAAPDSIDLGQYAALKEFRKWCSSRGLVETFFDESEFQTKLRRHIQIALQRNEHLRHVVDRDKHGSVGSVAAAGTVAVEESKDEIAATVASLSPEAKFLLSAAAAAGNDSQGFILTIRALVGLVIQAGNQQMGNPADARLTAKFEYGLEQLMNLRLVKQENERVYKLTEAGYQVADRLAQQ